VAAGVQALGSQVGHVTGVTLARTRWALERGEGLADTAANAATQGIAFTAYLTGLTGPTRPPGRAKRLSESLLRTGSQVALRLVAAKNPWVKTAISVTRIGRLVTSIAGSATADLSRTAKTGTALQKRRRFLLFKSTRPVTLWKSNLTPWLNRRDVLVGPERVRSSTGVIFKLGRTTWHRGTTRLETTSGRRTMTHLQSLAVPSAHYYFDRTLSDQAAVSIAAGQVDPRVVPGYVGQVSTFEALSPALASAKQVILKAYLHHSPLRGGPS
jgi:hypothetical protein